MTKPKTKHRKRAPGAGAPKGNQNTPKGPEKKLVSARLLLPVYDRLVARAAANHRKVSAEVEALLAHVLQAP